MEKTIFYIMGIRICVKRSDILNENVDAIVNPANVLLKMGGGLAKKIKQKGGEEIEKEAMKKGKIEEGEAIFTSSGNLPFKFIIHTATVDENFKSNYEIIRNCMKNTYEIADKLNIKSISFPALGCGAGKLESEEVAKIMAEETLRYFSKKFKLEEINFVIYRKSDYENFCKVFGTYFRDLTKKTYKNPVPTVDIIIEYKGGIVLIERKNYPFGWAIPGGFVEYGESCEETAIREAKEETGLDIEDLRQFKTYSNPERDPRFHTISTVFIAKGKGKLKSGDDAKNAKIFNKENLPENIAFDHRDILKEYFLFKNKLRSS